MTAADVESDLRSFLHSSFPRIKIIDLRGDLPVHPDNKYRRVSMDRRRGFCFHHTGAVGSIASAAKYHVSQGWPGLAYSFVIDPDGSLAITWDLDVRTYGQWWPDDADRPETIGDENEEWIAVLVNGFFRSPGYDAKAGAGEPTTRQMVTVLALTEFGETTGLLKTTGHCQLGKPACPGSTIETILRAVQFNESRREAVDLVTIRGRQIALKALGYYVGKIDGLWGWLSKVALREFQADAGIVVDGLWGRQSREAVLEALEKIEKEGG